MNPTVRRLSGVSIRTRVILAVVALTGMALLLAGLIVTSRGHSLTEQRVSQDLQLAADEFAALAADGIDRDTGLPFANAEALLQAAVQRSVLAANEGVLGIVDGGLRWTAQSSVTFRPERDPEFVAHVLPLAGLDQVSQGSLHTAQRDYRYLVMPVRFTDPASSGALVRAIDFDAEESLLAEVWRSYVLVAFGALVLVGLLIWILVGRLLDPIAAMRRTADQITGTDLSQRIPVRGSDDLSALGTTMNHMLDRLDDAVTGQRELLDDVGHELRTPLTIIRGHLDVMDANDAADVAATRELLLDETGRMGRLVEDLLTLARAEQPELLRPVPTDIARLTDETLAKASGLGQRHWVLEELADVEARVDPQRIAQAWLQLAANAVRYSEAGTTIGLGSAIRGRELTLWVRDEGVGMEPSDAERLTRRFERGAGGGTGLGLAIVSAILKAHGGHLEIDSTPGQGSIITMVVPERKEPA